MTPAELERWRRLVRRVGLTAPEKLRPAPASTAAVPAAPEPAPGRTRVNYVDKGQPLAGERWRKQCAEHDADTGRRCSLLAGHRGGHSASGREFWRVLQPGEQPAGREIDGLARTRGTSPMEGT